MDKELRILILEDNPADAELEEHELRKSGLVFISQVVDTRKAFLKALEEFLPDLILSDYELPSFDGITALKIAQEKCPDVPFILVTGKLGEEFVIENLKKGVTDYVLKDNLKRLVPVVKRALEEAAERAKLKQSQSDVLFSEMRYRRLFETAKDGIILLNAETGKIEDINPFLIEMLGYSYEEFLGKNLWEIGPFKNIQVTKKIFKDLQEKEYIRYEHLPLEAKGGKQIAVEFVSNVYTVDHKKIIQCNIRNITERKKAEKELKQSDTRLRDFLDNAGDMIQTVDIEGRYLYVNRKWQELLGYTPEEAKKMTFLDIVPKDQFQHCKDIFERVIRGEDIERAEMTFISKGGKEINVEASINALFEDVEFISCRGIFRDITERKKAQEALLESEEKYKTLTESSLTGVFIHQDGKYVFVNDRFAEIHGYKPEELPGVDHLTLIHPDSRDNLRERASKRLKGESIPQRYEIQRIRKDGKVIWCEMMVTRIQYKGRPAIMGNVTDITWRKQAEKELLEHKEQMESIFRASPIGIGVVSSPDRIILQVNERFCEMLGYSSEELVGKSARIVYPTDEEYEYVSKEKYAQIKKYGVGTVETRFKRKDNSIIDVLLSSSPIDPNNLSLGVTFTALDITERKKAEQQLAIFKKFAEASSLAYGFADLNGDIIYINQTLCRILGEERPEDALRKNGEIYYPDNMKSKLINEVLPTVKTKGGWTGEIPLQSIKGKVTPTIQNVSLIHDDKGKPLYIGNIITDITERKRSEEENQKKVKELEDFYRMAVGRENRMMELKKEIEKLKEELEKYKKQKN